MQSIAEATAQATGEPAFEVKGTIAPVTVLCLRTVEIARIERELRARVAQAPQLFANAPIVIDLPDVPAPGELPLAEIVSLARACKLVPVGVAHLPADSIALAADVGLAIMQLGFGRSRMARAQSTPMQPLPPATPVPVAQQVQQALAQKHAEQQLAQQQAAQQQLAQVAQANATVAAPIEPVSIAEPVHHEIEAPHKTQPIGDSTANTAVVPQSTEPVLTLTVRQPVRGGQVVYAKNSDLVVVAPVNSGAQVIADGHVHVYGPLRGRALAGAHGVSDARVFCQSLEAELVSIAGAFLSAEDIPQKLRGKPAQIFVEHGELRVVAL